jgi:hypothetical protein
MKKGIPLYLDPEVVEKFQNTLPRKKSVSSAVDEYMKAVVEENEKQKKLIALLVDNSAIKCMNRDNSKQINLDRFFGHGFMDYENWEERQELFNNLTAKQKHEVMIALNKTQRAWSSLIRTEEIRNKNKV